MVNKICILNNMNAQRIHKAIKANHFGLRVLSRLRIIVQVEFI